MIASIVINQSSSEWLILLWSIVGTNPRLSVGDWHKDGWIDLLNNGDTQWPKCVKWVWWTSINQLKPVQFKESFFYFITLIYRQKAIQSLQAYSIITHLAPLSPPTKKKKERKQLKHEMWTVLLSSQIVASNRGLVRSRQCRRRWSRWCPSCVHKPCWPHTLPSDCREKPESQPLKPIWLKSNKVG